MEPELLHTYSRVYKYDVLLMIVRLAVLSAVTLTVPVVLFPVGLERLQNVSQRDLALARQLTASSSTLCRSVPPSTST